MARHQAQRAVVVAGSELVLDLVEEQADLGQQHHRGERGNDPASGESAQLMHFYSAAGPGRERCAR